MHRRNRPHGRRRQRQRPSGRWFHVTDATVYFDHPVHAMAERTLNVDLSDAAAGPAARVALELTAPAARALVRAIQDALASAPPELLGELPARSGHQPP